MPGQILDIETGFHYNYHRYYDPRTGRYLTPDPIGLAAGLNLYVYLQNNPINQIDAFGLIAAHNPCEGDSCDQDFLDCLDACVSSLDPANFVVKTLLSVLGGPVPKSIAKSLGFRVFRPAGSSPFTTIPSIASSAARLGASNWVRTVGSVSSGVWLGYGWWMFGVEIGCTITCTQDSCSY